MRMLKCQCPTPHGHGEIQLFPKFHIFVHAQYKKFAPIQKQFRDSGSASLSKQKCPPHHLSNPQGYRDTTI